ncbi:MAG: DUF6445 family protein [Tahibacter sp.]
MPFNSHPSVTALPLFDGHHCYVVDDALRDPHGWVDRAAAHRDQFETTGHNAFPGPELRMPDALSSQLDDFFRLHIRQRLGARRTLRMYSRLAMVSAAAATLQPRQWICHRDRFEVPADQCVAASVLYLFRDASLGGTSFFRPRRAAAEIDRLVHDSGQMDGAQFVERYGIQPGYMTASNAWFEKVASVEARWNRLIFYDGSLFHCADITQTDKLDTDPRRGRLTLNGFFTCSRALR